MRMIIASPKIAAEKARRLAGQGFEILFTCFNRPLADHLREALADVEGVRVAGFHQLCMELAEEAEIPLSGDRGKRAFWERTLPSAFERAVEVLVPRLDALIVDEAQDFAEPWWMPLLLLLRDPDEGILYAHMPRIGTPLHWGGRDPVHGRVWIRREPPASRRLEAEPIPPPGLREDSRGSEHERSAVDPPSAHRDMRSNRSSAV